MQKLKEKMHVFNYSDNVLEMFFSRGFLYVQLCRFYNVFVGLKCAPTHILFKV